MTSKPFCRQCTPQPYPARRRVIFCATRRRRPTPSTRAAICPICRSCRISTQKPPVATNRLQIPCKQDSRSTFCRTRRRTLTAKPTCCFTTARWSGRQIFPCPKHVSTQAHGISTHCWHIPKRLPPQSWIRPATICKRTCLATRPRTMRRICPTFVARTGV